MYILAWEWSSYLNMHTAFYISIPKLIMVWLIISSLFRIRSIFTCFFNYQLLFNSVKFHGSFRRYIAFHGFWYQVRQIIVLIAVTVLVHVLLLVSL